MTTETSVNAALAWAVGEGFAVFPIVYGKKTPATKNGFKDATRDPERIRELFPPGRKHNLGIATGEVSGIVVIDVDTYKEGAEDTLKALEEELGPLPATLTVQTRTGSGRHYTYAYPEGRDLRNSVGEHGLGQGIDVRGNGGYIVGPGSWVAADDKGPAGSYKVLVDAPIAELPPAWVDRIEAISRGQKAKQDTPKMSGELATYAANVREGFTLPEVIHDGSRNATLFAYRGSLLGKGYAWQDVVRSVRDANAARCQPPLDDDELELTVLRPQEGPAGTAMVDGGAEEWPEPDEVAFSLPPVPPFDTERMLPPALAGYVVDQSDLMQTPPEAIAAPLIVAMGAALGSRVGILPKRHDGSWRIPGSNLWGFVCASPGRMKSEAVSRGSAPLKARERELATRNKAKRDQYEVDKVRYEMEQATFKREIKNGTQGVPVPQQPEEPQDERIIVVDVTVAKLGAICAASPHGVFVERDEMTGLLSQLGAVGHEGDREFFLTGWSGEAGFKVDRIGRGSLDIPRLILSLFGGIQPGKLANYVREATRGGVGADGLLPRFQIAVYPDYDRTFRNVDRPHDLAAQAAAFDAAKRLSEIDPTAIGAKPLVGVEGHFLQFTNEAQDLFDKWREHLEKFIRSGELHPAIESHYAKYRSLIPKLALIFHLVSDGAGPVTVGALVMAIRWGNFLKEHAKRIYAGAIHGADLATKALADRIKAGKVPSPFKSRDIYRAGWAGLSDKEDADLAIVGLLDAGWLRKEQTTGTGRTTAQYWINPKVGRKV